MPHSSWFKKRSAALTASTICGVRVSMIALVSPAVHRVCASLMLLSPHLPLIYMGEEYGEQNPFLFFCSFGDERLIEAVRSGRRRDYELEGEIPDPQAESSFTASRRRAAEIEFGG